MTTEKIDYIDLYLHGSDQTDYILNEPLELFYQEIELALQTGVEEIWGVKSSLDLGRYVFNKYVTITQIKNEISTYISNNCIHSTYFPYEISVEMLKNTNGSDLVYIVFNITAVDENGNPQSYKQKFLLGS
jgi:hypothetical protein